MICQECGFETYHTTEDEDCPICETPYTFRNPDLVREGHRMPWMLYKLALKSPAAALRIASSGNEMDVIRGAELVLESPWGIELERFDINLAGLDLEQLLRYDSTLRMKIVYWEWIQGKKGFAIPTGTGDYQDPMPVDLYRYMLQRAQVVSKAFADAMVWLN